tara:strand:+ start:402 stop:863 length:462 start_codon:yes stop_codon:yes gene_type:complete
MPINGVINGSEYLLIINYSYVMFGVSTSVQMNVSTKDISCRETDNWKKQLLSNRDWSMDFDGKFGFDYPGGGGASAHTGTTQYAFENLFTDLYTYQDRVTLGLIPYNSAGYNNNTPFWYGEAYISSINIDTPNEDNSTIALSFNGAGPLIQDD